MSRILLYGAYGYTGQLLANLAHTLSVDIVLAGRSGEKLAAVATEYDFEQRIFPLTNITSEDLSGIDVVLNAAGPFEVTAQPMIEACLANHCHYLDITGEVDVFEMAKTYDARAKDQGIVIMPGVGFDVAPSDCLARHVANRAPEADKLDLAFVALGGALSHGTAMTVVKNLGRGGYIRRDHKLIKVRDCFDTRLFPIVPDAKPKLLSTIPWGDVSTAYTSTGIPNIAVYTQVPQLMRRASLMTSYLLKGPIKRAVQVVLGRYVDRNVFGPTESERKAAQTYLYAEAFKGDELVAASRLRTPVGYTLTADVGLQACLDVVSQNVRPGYQTPATAFGADYILKFNGVQLQDIPVEPVQ